MSFPQTLNFIGELLSVLALADIDGELVVGYSISVFLTSTSSLFL